MVQIPYHFFRERFISGLSVAKPALDLLSERLEQASQNRHYVHPYASVSDPYSGFAKQKASPRTSIPELVERHGRFETAVLCATVENMACLCFLRQYGARGAVESTLPVLCERALDTFDFAFCRLSEKGGTLISLIVQSLDLDNPSGTPSKALGKVISFVLGACIILLAALDAVLRLTFGEDYLTLAHPKHCAARTFVRLRAKFSSWSFAVVRLQSSSHVIAFLLDRLFLLAYTVIVSYSILFAFLLVYTFPLKGTPNVKGLVSEHCETSDATQPGATTLRISDWRASGIQVVGFREQDGVYPMEEESFSECDILIAIEEPSSSESEEDEENEEAVDILALTPLRVSGALKGKTKEMYDEDDLMNSPTPLAGNVAIVGNADTPEVEDVFIGLSEYYEERKRHYGFSMGSLSCASSFSDSEALAMTASLTFDHISRLNDPVFLSSTSSTSFSEFDFGKLKALLGNERVATPLEPIGPNDSDVGYKRFSNIQTSPTVAQDRPSESRVCGPDLFSSNFPEAKFPPQPAKVSAHSRASSLDTVTTLESETRFLSVDPVQCKTELNSTPKITSKLAADAPPFIPRSSAYRVLNLEEYKAPLFAPAFWTPAPVVPVKIEPPPHRRSRSKSRRTRHAFKTVFPLRAFES